MTRQLRDYLLYAWIFWMGVALFVNAIPLASGPYGLYLMVVAVGCMMLGYMGMWLVATLREDAPFFPRPPFKRMPFPFSPAAAGDFL